MPAPISRLTDGHRSPVGAALERVSADARTALLWDHSVGRGGYRTLDSGANREGGNKASLPQPFRAIEVDVEIIRISDVSLAAKASSRFKRAEIVG